MTALALHFPKRSGTARWALSGAVIVAGHAIVIGALVLWYTRMPPNENLIPAIAVSLAPAAPAIQTHSDEAVAEQAVTAIETPPDPPKVEEKPIEKIIEPPPQEVKPLPQPAEVVLPKPPPKPIEKKPVERPPPREERSAAASGEAVRQASVASSNAYVSLVYGHLQRFKRYPAAAGNASGRVDVRFMLNRAGNVVSSSIARSSGNSILDQEALAILQRASPFPAFPSEKPGSQDSFVGPINFAR